MSTEMLKMLFGLLGGLAIFIYGMNLMGEGLQKAAGERMKHLLEVLTSNPIIAVLAGTFVTFILQSSSATTVMVVGFVSARLITLPQAICVIMGSNIGTTLTSQLIAFNIGEYAYPIAAIGFILFFLGKNKIVKYLGQTIFGFGLLFIGLNSMSDIMKPLAKSEVFANMILEVSKFPIVGLFVGTLMTVVVQSSTATTAALQNLASQQSDGGQALINLQAALPILLGNNIGTTITALLASIGARVNAKRAALVHFVFNVIGTLIFIWVIPIFAKFVQYISPKGLEYNVISRQIANAHTTFNIINTLLWLPFAWLLVKIVTFLIRGEDEVIEQNSTYLDYRMLDKPAIAMYLATKELARMAAFARQMMESSRNAFVNSDMKAAKNVIELEEVVDMLQPEIIKYLSTMLSKGELTERQSVKLAGLMHAAIDIERIGDHCKNIAEFAQQKETEHILFSNDAILEIKDVFQQLYIMVDNTIVSLNDDNTVLAKIVLSDEEKVDILEHNLRASHIERLNNRLCNPQATITFIELIHNLERIADHCCNIAEAVLADCIETK